MVTFLSVQSRAWCNSYTKHTVCAHFVSTLEKRRKQFVIRKTRLTGCKTSSTLEGSVSAKSITPPLTLGPAKYIFTFRVVVSKREKCFENDDS